MRVGVHAPLVPRHSWLGCAVWESVLGLSFGCAQHLLAGVLGCACARVRAPLVPRLSWLGCAVWLWVFGLGFRLRPATPGWGVWVCVLVCVLLLNPSTPGWGVRCGCVCLGSGFGCAPRLLAGVLGCVCAGVGALLVTRHSWLGCALFLYVLGFGLAAPRHSWLGCWGVRVGVRAPPVPRHSWLGCGVWMCVLGLGFLLRPATPGWGVGVCGCWCARSPCTPRLLAGVLGVGVGVWARVLAAPRQSWLGFWGVHVCVRAPLVPRHSWLGCAAWVCVFGFGFRLRPATPGWGVGEYVWWCGRSPCTRPLVTRVCGAAVGVWARV